MCESADQGTVTVAKCGDSLNSHNSFGTDNSLETYLSDASSSIDMDSSIGASSSRSNSSAAPLDANQDGRLFPEKSHACGECCSGYMRLLQEREYQALEISRGEVYIAKLEEQLTQFKEKAEKRDKQERNKKRFRVHLVHKENVQDFPQRDTIRTKIARKLGMSNVNQTFS